MSSVNGGNPGEAVNGTYGTLTLNADGTYTYQLTPCLLYTSTGTRGSDA